MRTVGQCHAPSFYRSQSDIQGHCKSSIVRVVLCRVLLNAQLAQGSGSKEKSPKSPLNRRHYPSTPLASDAICHTMPAIKARAFLIITCTVGFCCCDRDPNLFSFPPRHCCMYTAILLCTHTCTPNSHGQKLKQLSNLKSLHPKGFGSNCCFTPIKNPKPYT